MNKNTSQFIINLVKLSNGYAFDSYQQAENVSNRKKSVPKDKTKNPPNRIHRIFRQLALDNVQPEDLLNPIQELSEQAPKQPELEIQQQFTAQIKRQNGIPQSPAKWYNQSSIHQIEKQSLPQFFNNNSYKTPSLYIKLRNFIVFLYRKNPTMYLTKIACRRILRGDVNTIMRIHSFLQREGVINFGVSKQGNYSFFSLIFSTVLNQQPKIGISNIKNQDKDQQQEKQLLDMTNITLSTVNKAFSKSNRVFCSKCNSICGTLWFKQKDQSDKNLYLCVLCYSKLTGAQSQQYIKTDIVKKIQTGSQQTKAVWSIDDNLKLLQFVSKPSQNWQSLENSFQKKKSFDDIMLQFMQFPIANFDALKQKQKLQKQAIIDSPQNYVNKLIQKFYKSSYIHQNQNHESFPLTNNKFTQNSINLTQFLCKKFQTQISTNLQIQNLIQTTQFHLLNERTINSKKIQNQQISYQKTQNKLLLQDNQKNRQEQFDNEQSQSNQNQQQFNQRQNQEQHHQIINIKDQEFEEFIDNLNFN